MRNGDLVGEVGVIDGRLVRRVLRVVFDRVEDVGTRGSDPSARLVAGSCGCGERQYVRSGASRESGRD